MHDVVEIFTFLAYAVPTIMLLSGIFLLVIGYPIHHADIITAGGIFIVLGGGIFILEFLILLIRYYSRNESDEEAQSYAFLTPRYADGKSPLDRNRVSTQTRSSVCAHAHGDSRFFEPPPPQKEDHKNLSYNIVCGKNAYIKFFAHARIV